jgi:SAM-dependent methyltransferase
MSERSDGKRVFDEVADEYDAARPGYPRELIEDIILLSGLPPGGRLLEIGCGPGKATLPFAERGYEMLCLEPGPHLAELARERVRSYPRVQIVVSSFEDWPLQALRFDLVIAASSFHWVAPEVGFPKVAAALKDSGAFAIFRNARGLDDSQLSHAIQRAYADHAPSAGEWKPWQPPDPKTDPRRLEIEATGLFSEVIFRFHPWQKEYTAPQYLALLDTYSDHRSMLPAQRARLDAALAAAIQAHGGIAAVQYVSTLYLARK